MKMKIGMAALAVSLPILMSPPALADIYTPGIEYCRNDPAACGITVNNNNDGSTEQGRQECRNDPFSCGITVNNNNDGSTEQGRQECRNNPSSCGITEDINDGSEQDGIQRCQEDPKFCGLEAKGSGEEGKKKAESSSWEQLGLLLSLGEDKDIKEECGEEKNPVTCSFEKAKAEGESDKTSDFLMQLKLLPTLASVESIDDDCKNPVFCSFDKGKIDGIVKCQTDPESCEISVDPDDGSTEAGITACQEDPGSCDININNATERAVTQTLDCQTDPSNTVCGELKSNKTSPYVFLSVPEAGEEGAEPFGILYIPRLKVQTNDNKPGTHKDIYLTWIPTADGSIVFQWVPPQPADETPGATDEPTTETEEENPTESTTDTK